MVPSGLAEELPPSAEADLLTAVEPQNPLAHLIERLVWTRTGGNVRELCVEVDGEDVRLTGRTDTYYVKQLASHAVMERFGRICLTNDISVN